MLKPISMLALSLPLMVVSNAMADDSASLKQKLEELNSLHAEFSQTVTDINGKVIQQGSGTFALSVPNQFYWHLTSPDESLIVADGNDVWIYNPFAEEVSVLDLNQAIDASPIALLVHRDEKTWQQYSVTLENRCYQIVPKDIDAGVTKVAVCFDDNSLSMMTLEDQQGNISEFNLTEQGPVSDSQSSLFKFVVPEGVDIDDQRLKTIN
ncbi:outer-membrane lipoprotein carrier protein [Shewanella colwelliana]|uniref:Outer-membrane lipoprotein carrier protein n=1 Tax=Shewanella colwelliana TaxID=23 RepID=A0A1E5IP36_SHECO|nr:outer membrane lipoprotein chaperone LolA [Shewanella colwelliana]MDX1282372.1 outer membrane lipoprotein chaperone LolA [Shewanella colwelliana]OEG72269.1 outer membrane lipoprotein carrier protein LolA [Shewanella colwelliana]OEG75736.1 outer membrane lipoprotein carrier protein LolA [Shewanella colwelliana]GIU30499.1 outer-membrane lipoprotein carrier protein [Shewanella colwelliana]GIU43262.1 outer-membrane lipoprotein carrier protein [Shewanella colwelliana]